MDGQTGLMRESGIRWLSPRKRKVPTVWVSGQVHWWATLAVWVVISVSCILAVRFWFSFNFGLGIKQGELVSCYLDCLG